MRLELLSNELKFDLRWRSDLGSGRRFCLRREPSESDLSESSNAGINAIRTYRRITNAECFLAESLRLLSVN